MGGWVITDTQLEMHWVRPVRKGNGIQHMEAVTLKLNGPKIFWMSPVQTITHIIDETSPMYSQDLMNLEGNIWICGSGHDRLLDTNETFAMCYKLEEDLEINKMFNNVYQNSPLEAIKNGETIVIDIAQFDKYTSVSTESAFALKKSMKLDDFEPV